MLFANIIYYFVLLFLIFIPLFNWSELLPKFIFKLDNNRRRNICVITGVIIYICLITVLHIFVFDGVIYKYVKNNTKMYYSDSYNFDSKYISDIDFDDVGITEDVNGFKIGDKNFNTKSEADEYIKELGYNPKFSITNPKDDKDKSTFSPLDGKSVYFKLVSKIDNKDGDSKVNVTYMNDKDHKVYENIVIKNSNDIFDDVKIGQIFTYDEISDKYNDRIKNTIIVLYLFLTLYFSIIFYRIVFRKDNLILSNLLFYLNGFLFGVGYFLTMFILYS